MIFTLEALEAKQGDCLMLHYGPSTDPHLIVIDGGPSGVYKNRLSKRLDEIKETRSPGNPMPVRMVIVSHIDDDHINGILEWFKKLSTEVGAKLPYKIAALWHNSFNDILNDDAKELTSTFAASIKAAAAGTAMPAHLPLKQPGAAMLANVPQGRDLRNCAKTMGVMVNQGSNMVMIPEGAKTKEIAIDPTLKFTVLGPFQAALQNLQKTWDKEIKKLGLAEVADFIDKSVYNLSSIIVLAEAAGKSMLLTGDARGDEILQGLNSAGRLQGGKCHVDILKLPHHGSDNNVSLDFFKAVTADHYVCSGNGMYGNPELTTLKMILDARGSEAYTMYFTNREARLDKFVKKDTRPNKNYQIVYRNDTDLSVRVDLAEPLED